MTSFIQERIKIWEGLDNFRQILLDILSHGVVNINQNTLDKLFSGYNLTLEESRRNLLVEQIDQQCQSLAEDSEDRQVLEAQKQELMDLDEELILKRQTSLFHYEYILKEKNNFKNLTGFVKIISLTNPRHRALLSWQQQSRQPVIFLAELIPSATNPQEEDIYFHINLGKADGTAVIYETADEYIWTQIDAHEYIDMVSAETGSIAMNKVDGTISLKDGNIAAAQALTKAKTQNKEGVNIFENNVKLMQMYKEDLQKLSFDY